MNQLFTAIATRVIRIKTTPMVLCVAVGTAVLIQVLITPIGFTAGFLTARHRNHTPMSTVATPVTSSPPGHTDIEHLLLQEILGHAQLHIVDGEADTVRNNRAALSGTKKFADLVDGTYRIVWYGPSNQAGTFIGLAVNDEAQIVPFIWEVQSKPVPTNPATLTLRGGRRVTLDVQPP